MLKNKPITLLRVIPTMTFIHFLTGKSSGILSDIFSDILSGISSGITSGILPSIPSGIYSDIFFFPRAFLTAKNPVPDCVYTGRVYTGQSPDVHGQQTVFILDIQNPLMYGGLRGWVGRRLVVGLPWGCWVSRSPKGGSGPSMLVVVEAGRWRRLHAKDRMAAADKWAAHREIQAWRAAGRRRIGMD